MQAFTIYCELFEHVKLKITYQYSSKTWIPYKIYTITNIYIFILKQTSSRFKSWIINCVRSCTWSNWANIVRLGGDDSGM